MTSAALTTAWVPKPPVPPNAATASPTFRCVTPAPTASMTPAYSEPGTKGRAGFIWYLFWTMSRSGKVEAGGADRDAHFAGLRLGRRQLLPLQRLDADRVFAKPGVHVLDLRECSGDRGWRASDDDTQRLPSAARAGRLPTIFGHAHPHRQRRRLPRARPGRARQGLRRPGRSRRRRARAERERHLELADPESRPLGLHRRQRLSLHQRHAVRLRPPRALGPARAAARPGRRRHQPGRQHGRRHALFGHRRRGDGRLPVRHSGDRLFAGAKGLAGSRRGGARRAQRHRARAARSAGGGALSAQRQHPEPRRCRHACRAASPASAGATRASR